MEIDDNKFYQLQTGSPSPLPNPGNINCWIVEWYRNCRDIKNLPSLVTKIKTLPPTFGDFFWNVQS
jgi:hypothetical protein